MITPHRALPIFFHAQNPRISGLPFGETPKPIVRPKHSPTPPPQPRIDWTTTLFLLGTPALAVTALPTHIAYAGVQPAEIVTFALLSCASALGITMGYHRLFSHRTYQAHPVLRFVLLVMGAWAFQASALKWSSNHRIHHRFVDTERDPHNAKRGFWYSHLLWLFRADPADQEIHHVRDLRADPLVMWQHRNYLFLAASGMLLPTAVGLAWGDPWGFFLWGGILRAVFVHQSTFFVNSAAHLWGKQTYNKKVSARDSWWVALLTFGEGYHSFHHRFPGDYRNGVRWHHWDPTKWLIYLCERVGLARQLHRTTEEVLRSRAASSDD